jgi:hypothetical protein
MAKSWGQNFPMGSKEITKENKLNDDDLASSWTNSLLALL